MGNDLCNSTPVDDDYEKVEAENPDEARPEDEVLAQMSRMTKEPRLLIAFNIDKLPLAWKQSEKLTEIQDLIAKLMSHEKRHHKAFVLTKDANYKNALPNPYLIRSINAVYVGEWVTHPSIKELVPGGLGRLYKEDRIIEGEIMTISKAEGHVFDEQAISSAQPNFSHNKEKANFFKTSNKA